MNKKQYGQFFTKNAAYITQGLLNIFPDDAIVIDPFVGEGDLIKLINNRTEIYDINPLIDGTIKKDTLLNEMNYNGKWIFTNPPFLAKNKNKDKSIYNKYQTNDLYKAALLSIIGCNGGIIILPLNFFSSDDKSIRTSFLSLYKIIKVNVFEEQVFDDTTYTICAFSFIKQENNKQSIPFNFFPREKEIIIDLEKNNGYTIGNEIYNLEQYNIIVKRLLIGDDEPNSKIFLHAIDTGTEQGKIRLTLRDEPFYGKNTDRAFATITFNKDFSLEQQQFIVNTFNKKLNEYREKYNSLFLTNYRNSTSTLARKRIGFKLAYSIISNIISETIDIHSH